MLGFQYWCLRHQRLFIDTVEREGCRDPEKLEHVRRQMLAWLSQKFPRMVSDHFNAGACIGCAIDDARLDAAEMYKAIRDIARATTSGAPLTDARH